MANPYEIVRQKRESGLSVEDKLSRYEADPNTGCWLWLGAIATNGYGVVCDDDGRKIGAHRFFYEQAQGAIPEGMHVCHHCDTRPCVNPAHLFIGSANDNNRDKFSKGRQAYGVRHGNAVLTDLQITDIRRSSEFPSVLAEIYGISVANVLYVRSGRGWTHLPPCNDEYPKGCGIRKPAAKLTDSDIPTIRQLRDKGLSYQAIANRFGVRCGTIRAAYLGRTWKHVA